MIRNLRYKNKDIQDKVSELDGTPLVLTAAAPVTIPLSDPVRAPCCLNPERGQPPKPGFDHKDGRTGPGRCCLTVRCEVQKTDARTFLKSASGTAEPCMNSLFKYLNFWNLLRDFHLLPDVNLQMFEGFYLCHDLGLGFLFCFCLSQMFNLTFIEITHTHIFPVLHFK